MNWYNPLSWFKKDENTPPNEGTLEDKLICDYHKCRKPILSEELAYSPEFTEFYHPGNCAIMATTYKAFNSKKTVKTTIDYITRKEALEIKRNES